MTTPTFEDKENKNFLELSNKIKEVFEKLRDCINEREKNLLNNLDKIMNKKKQIDFINKMINDLNKIKENYNKNKLDLEENNLIKMDRNISNLSNTIEDIGDCKKDLEINNKYKFIYEENTFNDILNKIKNLGELKNLSDNLFKWKKGQNYTLSGNDLIATKTNGGSNHNCNILGDFILPKNQINKWKIKLKKYSITSYDWNIIVGVGPSNLNQNENNLYNKTWTFICGSSNISIKSGSPTIYKGNKKLKEGDIVEVIMNNITGELSFSVNDINYGVACKIPLNIDLSPFVCLYVQGDSVELLKQ